jgi:hypothetical protein
MRKSPFPAQVHRKRKVLWGCYSGISMQAANHEQPQSSSSISHLLAEKDSKMWKIRFLTSKGATWNSSNSWTDCWKGIVWV